MTRWAQRWDIKQFLQHDDADPERVAIQLADYLETRGESLTESGFDVYELDRLADIVGEFRDSLTQEEVNWTLETLYDWADANRVWLGLL